MMKDNFFPFEDYMTEYLKTKTKEQLEEDGYLFVTSANCKKYTIIPHQCQNKIPFSFDLSDLKFPKYVPNYRTKKKPFPKTRQQKRLEKIRNGS